MEFHCYSEKCAFSSLEDIKGKKITVMGLGLNGGGEAAVRFFLKHGAYVIATDMKSEEILKPTIERLNNDKNLDTSKLTYRLGEHRIEDFENADCVIKNPGVKFEGNKFLQAAKNIETDLSIFLRFTQCPIIAVTGSKGKSSTVSAIHYGLKQAGFNAFLGGNITVSPLTFFDEVSKETPVVLELSSWQLADLRGRNVLKPFISIITKIVPDHQNWYGNMEDYVKDKRLIYADQVCTKENSCYSIFDAEGDEVGQEPDKNLHSESSWGQLFANESNACVLRYGKSKLNDGVFGAWLEETKASKAYGKVFLPGMKEPECILNGLSVPGEHMKTNVLNAALTLFLMGVEPAKIVEICKSWPGIDHRLQYFHTWHFDGKEYKFYNDSCATVPEAAAMATQAFEKSVILFTGGTEKGLSLKPLIDVLKNKGKFDVQNKNKIFPVKEIYLLEGSATDSIIEELQKSQVDFFGPFDGIDSLLCKFAENQKSKKACEKLEEASKEEIVVFSPGATSFGMFLNEFDRGNQFMSKVKAAFK